MHRTTKVALTAAILALAATCGPAKADAPAQDRPAKSGEADAMTFSEMLRRSGKGEIASLGFKGDHRAIAKTRDGLPHEVSIPFVGAWTVDLAEKDGVEVDYGPYDKSAWSALDRVSGLFGFLMQVGFLALVVLMIAFMLRMVRSRKGVGTWVGTRQPWLFSRLGLPFMGSLKAPDTRFDDVAGAEEAKASLEEVVSFLRDAKRYDQVGARQRRGVLLIGDPGNGKTLLARAVAGEAGVPFLSTTGSDFQEMFAGLGAARVRGIFKQLRKRAPAILFIDEIDSVGRTRAQGSSAVENDSASTLNQLLTELDGLDAMKGVVVIGATNRVDVLDPALVRAGRFDQKIQVPNPDLGARESILAIHAGSRRLSDDVDLLTMARGTPGFSGADLATLVNEAAIGAVRRGATEVAMQDFEDARDAKLLGGAERRGTALDEDEMDIVIAHESGHALVATLLPHCDPVHKGTVTPRGRSLGHIAAVPLRDQVLVRRAKALDTVCMLLGGRAGEEIAFGDDAVTSGATSDIDEVTRVVRDMVSRYGMGSTMASRVDESNAFSTRQVSEESKAAVDREVERIVSHQYKRALVLIRDNAHAYEALRALFKQRETLTGDEIREVIRDAPLAEAAE